MGAAARGKITRRPIGFLTGEQANGCSCSHRRRRRRELKRASTTMIDDACCRRPPEEKHAPREPDGSAQFNNNIDSISMHSSRFRGASHSAAATAGRSGHFGRALVSLKSERRDDKGRRRAGRLAIYTGALHYRRRRIDAAAGQRNSGSLSQLLASGPIEHVESVRGEWPAASSQRRATRRLRVVAADQEALLLAARPEQEQTERRTINHRAAKVARIQFASPTNEPEQASKTPLLWRLPDLMIASDGRRALFEASVYNARSRFALPSRSKKTKCTHPDPDRLGSARLDSAGPLKRRFQRINQSISRARARRRRRPR